MDIKKIVSILTLMCCCVFVVGLTFVCKQQMDFFAKYLCCDGLCGTIFGIILRKKI